jgi:hypothetical protein
MKMKNNNITKREAWREASKIIASLAEADAKAAKKFSHLVSSEYSPADVEEIEKQFYKITNRMLFYPGEDK